MLIALTRCVSGPMGALRGEFIMVIVSRRECGMVKLLALVAINLGWFTTAAASWLLVY